jgi:hypothetical protein
VNTFVLVPEAGTSTPVAVCARGADLSSCPADLDCSGTVDSADLGNLLGQWGPCLGDCSADFDHSGLVDAADLGYLLGEWGACP